MNDPVKAEDERITKIMSTWKKPRKTWDFETCVYLVGPDDEEWEIRVGISYDCTYDPGIYSGPWEDSYPAYGDMDLTELIILDDLPLGMTEEQVKSAAADDQNKDRIEQECWDHYFDERNFR